VYPELPVNDLPRDAVTTGIAATTDAPIYIAMTDAMPTSHWSASAFLAALARCGIVLLTGNGVIVAYPEAQLTAADRPAIREHRTPFVHMLAAAVVVD
jgi:hypothetical protein